MTVVLHSTVPLEYNVPVYTCTCTCRYPEGTMTVRYMYVRIYMYIHTTGETPLRS